MEKNLKQEINDNSDAVNKLLLDMNKNQKESSQNLIKVFIATIICYTLLLIAMVVGFFVYESQFETIDGEYETYEYNQEGSGDNVEFNNVSGDMYTDDATNGTK